MSLLHIISSQTACTAGVVPGSVSKEKSDKGPSGEFVASLLLCYR
jgi:hypothetical protein